MQYITFIANSYKKITFKDSTQPSVLKFLRQIDNNENVHLILCFSIQKKKSKPVDENIAMALNEVISSINMYYGIFPIKQFLTNLVYHI